MAPIELVGATARMTVADAASDLELDHWDEPTAALLGRLADGGRADYETITAMHDPHH